MQAHVAKWLYNLNPSFLCWWQRRARTPLPGYLQPCNNQFLPTQRRFSYDVNTPLWLPSYALQFTDKIKYNNSCIARLFYMQCRLEIDIKLGSLMITTSDPALFCTRDRYKRYEMSLTSNLIPKHSKFDISSSNWSQTERLKKACLGNSHHVLEGQTNF